MPPFSEKTHGEAYCLHRLAGGRAEKTTPLASEQSHAEDDAQAEEDDPATIL
jgi:hypothetical protein